MPDLHEIEAIKQLKYRYLRFLDQKRWDDLAQCFTDDATCSYDSGRYAFAGRAEILDFLRRAMGAKTLLSSHRVHHPEIELTSPTTARGTWALEDTVLETMHGMAIRGAAFYEDEYVKQDGAWRIRSTGYRRTFETRQALRDVEVIPGDAAS